MSITILSILSKSLSTSIQTHLTMLYFTVALSCTSQWLQRAHKINVLIFKELNDTTVLSRVSDYLCTTGCLSV